MFGININLKKYMVNILLDESHKFGTFERGDMDQFRQASADWSSMIRPIGMLAYFQMIKYIGLFVHLQ